MRENMIYDTDIYQIRIDILERMKEIIENRKQTDVVFYGDSITKYMDICKYFHFNAVNNGIVGISSNMLLNFVDEGVIKYNPKEVFIMIGTNDLGNTTMTSPRQIALNVKTLVEIIHENLNDVKIYLISCIPCIEEFHGYQYKKEGLRSNDTLKMVFDEYKKVIPYDYVSFLDVYDSLFDDKGRIMENAFVDGLHLSEDGYKYYTDAIKIQLEKVRGQK